jgi:hypothetical protein
MTQFIIGLFIANLAIPVYEVAKKARENKKKIP